MKGKKLLFSKLSNNKKVEPLSFSGWLFSLVRACDSAFKFIKGKHFQRWLVFVITVWVLLEIAPVGALEPGGGSSGVGSTITDTEDYGTDGKISGYSGKDKSNTNKQAYQTIQNLNKYAQGTEVANSFTSSGNYFAGILQTVVCTAGGTLCIPDDNLGAYLSDPNVSDIEKYGYMNFIGDGVKVLAYKAVPEVNVPQYLAEQWVPGYSNSQYGIYAQEVDCSVYPRFDLTPNGDLVSWIVACKDEVNGLRESLNCDILMSTRKNDCEKCVDNGQNSVDCTVTELEKSYNSAYLNSEKFIELYNANLVREWEPPAAWFCERIKKSSQDNNCGGAYNACLTTSTCSRSSKTLDTDCVNILQSIEPNFVDVCYVDPALKGNGLSWGEGDTGFEAGISTTGEEDILTAKGFRREIESPNGWGYLSALGVNSLWSKFLIIAYSLFVIVLIIAGFMIMFRSKLGGQTAVTVYNTLPKVVIAMIVATFSFAIVGTILNVSVFATKLAVSVMGFKEKDEFVAMDSPFALITASREEQKRVGAQSFTGFGDATTFTKWSTDADSVNKNADAGMKALTEFLWGLLTLVIFYVMYLSASIKVYMMLFTTLLNLIVQTIFAPIIAVFSAVPGQDALLKNWFSNVLRASFTFPVVTVLVNVPNYIFRLWSENKFLLGIKPLTQGNFDDPIEVSGLIMTGIIMVLPLLCYNAAANAPTMLNDIFPPAQQGKGTQEFIGRARSSLANIPLVGGLLAGGGK